MAQYTFTGYDASAHLSEETHNASPAAPRGIVMSVVVSLVAGFLLLFAVTWAIQGYEAERTSATGFPPAQIFIDSTGRHTGEFLLFICVVAQFFCGMASVTANSRMTFAFSRDGALPGSRLWREVNTRTGTPTNSIWLCVVCAIVLAAPSLEEPVRIRRVDRDRGDRPLRLLRDSGVPATAATGTSRWARGTSASGAVRSAGPRWSGCCMICVMFMLPTVYPIVALTFNYTIVAVAVVLGGAWHLVDAQRPQVVHRAAAEHFHRRHSESARGPGVERTDRRRVARHS